MRAGELHYAGDAPADAGAIRRMTAALAHRGPDDEGIYLDSAVGLGHRRLSIIDPAGGHQPLANADESVWIAYNGTVYNSPEHAAPVVPDVEGLDAERVAREQQTPRAAVPQRQGVHAVEARQRLQARLFVGVDDDLGSCARTWSSAATAFAPAATPYCRVLEPVEPTEAGAGELSARSLARSSLQVNLFRGSASPHWPPACCGGARVVG